VALTDAAGAGDAGPVAVTDAGREAATGADAVRGVIHPGTPPPKAHRVTTTTTLDAALGNSRALVCVLSFVDDVRDLEACACTAARCFAANDGVRHNDKFPCTYMQQEDCWNDEFDELESQLAEARLDACRTPDSELVYAFQYGGTKAGVGLAELWEDEYRNDFLRLYTLGLLTGKRTYLAPPAGVDDDAVGLEAEAARLLAANGTEMERAQSYMYELEDSTNFTPLEIAKIACRARHWRDPFGEGHDAFDDLAPGWTLPPRSALRSMRESPFSAPRSEYSGRHYADDIIYRFQGSDREYSPENICDRELRLYVNELPSRVPSIGTSLLNLGGATDPELARRRLGERQQHATLLAEKATDRLGAEKAAKRARQALGLERRPLDTDQFVKNVHQYYAIAHTDMYLFHRGVLEEAARALQHDYLPENLIEAVQTRFIPLAEYNTVFAERGDPDEGASHYGNLIFTFAAKTTRELSFEDAFFDTSGVEFMVHTFSSCGGGIGGWSGEILMRSVDRTISGTINRRDAHHAGRG